MDESLRFHTSGGVTRREFLRNTALIAALHGPLWCAAAQEAPPEVRLRRLRLKANNLEALEPFYREVLRLPTNLVDGVLRVTAGASEIEFTADASLERPFYHFAFTIPENQLEPAMTWLEPRCPIANIRATSQKIMHFRSWHAESFYFFDPAGNILEFIVHHPLENGDSRPFDESQILHISEIGLVVPDVGKARDILNDGLGLKPYIDYSDNFAPIGDVHGLLIVCKTDRIWLPTTDVPAQIFPTLVEMEGPAGRLEMDGLPYTVERTA